jgi:acyl-CoA thioester hydrolase
MEPAGGDGNLARPSAARDNAGSMSDRPSPLPRAAFRWFTPIDTRWHDNDVFGHVNNVVYYAYFDTAVNRHLIEGGVLDLRASTVVGVVGETACTYFASVAYPDRLQVGLAVTRIGRSSVTYRLGLFRDAAETCAALCRFTHVYVDRARDGATVEIPPQHRRLFAQVATSDAS